MKLRDAAQLIADAANEYVESMAPPGIPEKKPEKQWSWDPEKIKKIQTKGARGEYERYPAEGSKAEVVGDYKALISDLKEHKMFLFRDGWNYWLFPDLATVGRRREA